MRAGRQNFPCESMSEGPIRLVFCKFRAPKYPCLFPFWTSLSSQLRSLNRFYQYKSCRLKAHKRIKKQPQQCNQKLSDDSWLSDKILVILSAQKPTTCLLLENRSTFNQRQIHVIKTILPDRRRRILCFYEWIDDAFKDRGNLQSSDSRPVLTLAR